MPRRKKQPLRLRLSAARVVLTDKNRHDGLWRRWRIVWNILRGRPADHKIRRKLVFTPDEAKAVLDRADKGIERAIGKQKRHKKRLARAKAQQKALRTR